MQKGETCLQGGITNCSCITSPNVGLHCQEEKGAEKCAAIQPFLFEAQFLSTGTNVETTPRAPPIATSTTQPTTTLKS